jgi:hypothetical protein
VNIEIGRDGKISREQVWLTAWCMVAMSDSCKDLDVPTKWADKCLGEYDKRFPTPAPEGGG